MAKPFYPNGIELLGDKYYVAQNNPAASNNNPGTPEKPFKTISAAMKNIQPSDHVYIDEGIYREEIPLPTHGHYYVPLSQIHFHAVEGKEVYVRGSDVFESSWEKLDSGLFQAALPADLFEDGTYNPYKLALPMDIEETVRPYKDDKKLPKTKGQIYVDDITFNQKESIDEVRDNAHSFIVSADGKNIIANFGAIDPNADQVELTVRKKCIAPTFGGPLMIQVRGICVEHAAEPGAFCKARPESVRNNPELSANKVIKTFSLPGVAGNNCTLISSQVSYLSKDNDTMVATVIDDTFKARYNETVCVMATSDDYGRTWKLDESSRKSFAEQDPYNYSLDEKRNILMRSWNDNVHGRDPHGAFGDINHNVMFQFSKDNGKTWSTPELINDQKIYPLSIEPLDDGTYIWSYYTGDGKNCKKNYYHGKIGTFLGKWNENETAIEWTPGGEITVTTEESHCGLGEPNITQFPDGRLIVFLRAGSMLPSQDSPGATSAKLFSISEDGGKSWSYPEPLCYEDGKYIYSPRAYHMSFRSIKNGKVYIAMNIANEPCHNCDPRTHLYLAEVDPKTLRVPKDGLTLIEGVHEEHYHLVRFSNFQFIQDRSTGNPVIFMKLDMCQHSFILMGYDKNSYRYEICL